MLELAGKGTMKYARMAWLLRFGSLSRHDRIVSLLSHWSSGKYIVAGRRRRECWQVVESMLTRGTVEHVHVKRQCVAEPMGHGG
jgi:hypothetical protein